MDSKIARLRRALDLSSGGDVFIILVNADFDGEILPDATALLSGAQLLSASSVTEAFAGSDEGSTEILFDADQPLTVKELRWLNQQREQLRRKHAVVLRVPAQQAGRFAKYAPDVWRWATVLDLTGEDTVLAKPRPATGMLEENPYAPILDPADVAEPTADNLKALGLDES